MAVMSLRDICCLSLYGEGRVLPGLEFSQVIVLLRSRQIDHIVSLYHFYAEHLYFYLCRECVVLRCSHLSLNK